MPPVRQIFTHPPHLIVKITSLSCPLFIIIHLNLYIILTCANETYDLLVEARVQSGTYSPHHVDSRPESTRGEGDSSKVHQRKVEQALCG